jgi:4-hydroxyacetophenone monooxygenase
VRSTDRPDENAVRAALGSANMNVLRMALYQATRDPALAAMKVEPVPLRGGAFIGYTLAAEHHAEVAEKALRFLLDRPDPDSLPRPDPDEVRAMMGLLTGERLTDRAYRFGREELALDDFPREARWTASRPAAAADHTVVIIGAGASGISAGIQFERLGIPYTIIERQDGIGGTWHLNHYPDARVDTSSYLYQFKFEKNYPWPEYFASQAEVKRYLEHVARKHGVYDKIQFNQMVTSARFAEDRCRWRLEASSADGGTRVLEASVVISAAGMFSTPKLPEIPGIEEFEGRLFHSTAWDDSYTAEGDRVAVIGNGSTGVQIMPRLARTAARMYAFQRTPQWISPMEGYRETITPEVRWLLDNMPFYWNWFCYSAQVTSSTMQGAQVYDPKWRKAHGGISERNDGLRRMLTDYIREKVGHDPELFAKCLPDYAPLARRLVVDNGWYDALLRDNVELVTSGIDRITPRGIRTADGVERELDAIVFASGFEVTKYLWPTEYVGRGGVRMEDLWEKDGPRAYLGLTVPGFPNLFIFYGPNSQPRAGAFLSWVEIWARYSAQAVVAMIESGGRSLEVRQQVFDDYNARLDEATKKLIWEKEGPAGKNYYVNRFGRQNVNLPWDNDEYFEMVESPDLADFDLR